MSVQILLAEFLAGNPAKPLLVIVGPTASGKTGFSIRLAEEMRALGRGAEIINADSRQFYRGLDIGTAKITPEEMKGVPHHLLSVLDPSETSTISWFKAEAAKVIREVQARGHIPMLVGGSMLYTSALVDGLEPLPPADSAIRERLMCEYDADAGETLFRRLTEIDPETAASFPRQNKVYVVRAMEIYESTGKPKSEQLRVSGSRYDALFFGMDIPMDELTRRIGERTEAMFRSGWVSEVQRLVKAGVAPDSPGMKSIGYREILKALQQETVDEASLILQIASATRAYAKRHRTWWKKDPRIHWVQIPGDIRPN